MFSAPVSSIVFATAAVVATIVAYDPSVLQRITV
jgi:hypothetical protein